MRFFDHAAQNSGQRLNNVDQTHLVLLDGTTKNLTTHSGFGTQLHMLQCSQLLKQSHPCFGMLDRQQLGK